MSDFMENWQIADEACWGTPAMHKQPLWEGWRFRRVMSGDVEVARVWCDEDDAEQNAALSLIAAAPELLAALKEIMFDVGDGLNCDPNLDTLAQCRQAIALAEGKA